MKSLLNLGNIKMAEHTSEHKSTQITQKYIGVHPIHTPPSRADASSWGVADDPNEQAEGPEGPRVENPEAWTMRLGSL